MGGMPMAQVRADRQEPAAGTDMREQEQGQAVGQAAGGSVARQMPVAGASADWQMPAAPGCFRQRVGIGPLWCFLPARPKRQSSQTRKTIQAAYS